MPKSMHGMSGSPEHHAWKAAKQRCENPSNPGYANYGGRGIKMCAAWRRSFIRFFKYMGPKPEGFQLNRINNSKGYEPGNCEWTTPQANVSNRRNNQMITWGGKTQTLTQWAQSLGVKPVSLFARLHRSGWSIEKALTVPFSKHNSGNPRKHICRPR